MSEVENNSFMEALAKFMGEGNPIPRFSHTIEDTRKYETVRCKCGNCGKIHQFNILRPTNEYREFYKTLSGCDRLEYSDNPLMMCDDCGYCNHNLEDEPDEWILKALKSKEFIEFFKKLEKHDFNTFGFNNEDLCRAYLMQHDKNKISIDEIQYIKGYVSIVEGENMEEYQPTMEEMVDLISIQAILTNNLTRYRGYNVPPRDITNRAEYFMWMLYASPEFNTNRAAFGPDMYLVLVDQRRISGDGTKMMSICTRAMEAIKKYKENGELDEFYELYYRPENIDYYYKLWAVEYILNVSRSTEHFELSRALDLYEDWKKILS